MHRWGPSRRRFLGAMTTVAAVAAAPRVLRAQTNGVLNVYSSRHYDTDKALWAGFERAAGLRLNVVEADADALIERMRSEGPNSPCDVLITVDAGRLERAREADLLQPVASAVLDAKIPASLRDPDGHWFGFTKRARVIMYAKDRVAPDAIATYEALADPAWRGKVLIRSSTNIYNQSLTGAMLAHHGPEATEAWCRGLVANFARPPQGGDTDQIKAVAAGEGDLAVANTYYLGRLLRSEKPEDRELAAGIGIVFPNQADRGTHVNVSGAGIARYAPNPTGAQAFLEYMTGDEAQFYFADGNNEYPVVAGVKWPETMMAFGEFKADELNAQVFAANNAEALMIMDRAGWR